MVSFFKNDLYETTANTKLSPFSSYQLTRNIFFYWWMFRMVLRANRIANNGTYNYDEWAKSSFKTVEVAESCGAKLYIKGLNNFRNINEPVIFIGNHMSVFETFAMASMLIPEKKPVFIIKKELLDYPLFGKVMRSIKYIAVSRKNPKDDFKEVIEQGTTFISEGYSPVIFPQSTRMREFIPEKFSTIGIKLAKKANTPIIPFALKTDFWDTGKFIKDFGHIGKRTKKIFFEFSEPIIVSGNGKDQHEKIIKFIQSKLATWMNE